MIFYALSLPSTQLDYAVTDHFFVGLSNNTEYIFFRGHAGNKGIAYTPSLTFSIWGYTPGDESCDAVALQVHFGRTFFWNFEGRNYTEGWTIGGTFSWGYHL